MKIFNKEFLIDLEKSILWQYDKAKNLRSLIEQKQAWYKKSVTDFIMDFFNNIFNIRTANDFGLTIWGKILNFNRQVVNKNDGSIINLSTEQYRFLLLGQVLKFKMSCTVPEINRYLRLIFNDTGNCCYVIDNNDMTIQYKIEAPLTEEIQTLVDNVDFLPRPAGVLIGLSQSLIYKVFVNVYNEKSELITDNTDITFIVDGEEVKGQKEITLQKGQNVTVKVEKEGYYSQQKDVTNIEENVTLDFNLELLDFVVTIINNQDATIMINGAERSVYNGKYGEVIEWSVSKSGYLSRTGTFTLKQNETLTINLTSDYNLIRISKDSITVVKENIKLSETIIPKDKVGIAQSTSLPFYFISEGKIYTSKNELFVPDNNEENIGVVIYTDGFGSFLDENNALWIAYYKSDTKQIILTKVSDDKKYKRSLFIPGENSTYYGGFYCYGLTEENELYRFSYDSQFKQSSLVAKNVTDFWGYEYWALEGLTYNTRKNYLYYISNGNLYASTPANKEGSSFNVLTLSNAGNFLGLSSAPSSRLGHEYSTFAWSESGLFLISRYTSKNLNYSMEPVLIQEDTDKWDVIYGLAYQGRALGIKNGDLYILGVNYSANEPPISFIKRLMSSNGKCTDISGGIGTLSNAYAIIDGKLYKIKGELTLIDDTRTYISVGLSSASENYAGIKDMSAYAIAYYNE